MKHEKRIFIWLAATQRRTQFIQWARDNGQGTFSHPTLSRAMERQYKAEPLTARQRGIAQVAEDFRATINDEATANESN